MDDLAFFFLPLLQFSPTMESSLSNFTQRFADAIISGKSKAPTSIAADATRKDSLFWAARIWMLCCDGSMGNGEAIETLDAGR